MDGGIVGGIRFLKGKYFSRRAIEPQHGDGDGEDDGVKVMGKGGPLCRRHKSLRISSCAVVVRGRGEVGILEIDLTTLRNERRSNLSEGTGGRNGRPRTCRLEGPKLRGRHWFSDRGRIPRDSEETERKQI